MENIFLALLEQTKENWQWLVLIIAFGLWAIYREIKITVEKAINTKQTLDDLKKSIEVLQSQVQELIRYQSILAPEPKRRRNS